jgi:hypothetical protein
VLDWVLDDASFMATFLYQDRLTAGYSTGTRRGRAGPSGDCPCDMPARQDQELRREPDLITPDGSG